MYSEVSICRTQHRLALVLEFFLKKRFSPLCKKRLFIKKLPTLPINFLVKELKRSARACCFLRIFWPESIKASQRRGDFSCFLCEKFEKVRKGTVFFSHFWPFRALLDVWWHVSTFWNVFGCFTAFG